MSNKVYECINPKCTIYKSGNQFKHAACIDCAYRIENLSNSLKDENTEVIYSESAEETYIPNFNEKSIENQGVESSEFLPNQTGRLKPLNSSSVILESDKSLSYTNDKSVRESSYNYSNEKVFFANYKKELIIAGIALIVIIFIIQFILIFNNSNSSPIQLNTSNGYQEPYGDPMNNQNPGQPMQGGNIFNYTFENTTDNWSGMNLNGNVNISDEWSYEGTKSLKVDFQRSENTTYDIETMVQSDYSDKKTIKAYIKNSSKGENVENIQAKLFMKIGDQFQVYNSESFNLDYDKDTEISYDISDIESKNMTRVIGVQIISNEGSTGDSVIYIDNVLIE
jgi:hypothetical protein